MDRKNDKRGTFNQLLNQTLSSNQSAYTLVEVMVASALLAFMVISLYAGISSGFAVIRVARENLRATQILQERMEVVRLIKWSDATPGFIPTNFVASFSATDPSAPASGDLTYTGTVNIASAPVAGTTYADSLRMIQIDLTWKSGNISRSRQMTTYVSKYGIQNYVY